MDEQLIKVGCIDAEIYSCITERITTSEVIITRERIAHIAERHLGDYERLIGDVSEALSEPDYILEANRPHTGIVLKELERNGEKIKLFSDVFAMLPLYAYKTPHIKSNILFDK